MKKKTILFSLLTLFIAGAITIWLSLPKPDLLTHTDFSQAFYDKNKQLLRLTLTTDDKYRLFTTLSEISPLMINASLLKEDKQYYQHYGINFNALIAAVWQTYIIKNQRRGASTITMQVAKLQYKLNTHTVLGKIQQIFFALQLERHYTKEQILEAYFNLTPYGSNVEGVGAASLIYYHHPAKQLSLPQALTLSVIPQSPEKRHLEKSPSASLLNARLNLFERWLQEYPQDKNLTGAIHLPLANYTKADIPFFSPHFIDGLLLKNSFFEKSTNQIITTLDLPLQKILERNLAHYIEIQKKHGIHNASAMLIDSRDMSVKALVGSGDFFNAKIKGQVNGTTAKRSPGSTLKPFIYALAIDQGLIHPATVLKDTPMSFGAYNPENFDYRFLGPLTATQALSLSRNIPAIYLANQLHHPSFYQFLSDAGISLRSEKEYGLALVLGGGETTMQQLTALYAMLANGGIYHSLRFLPTEKLDEGKRLLSPEASFLVLEMLQQTPNNQYNLIQPATFPVAWKTGTSSAYRDAWTVGVFGDYVLAVWIGNFTGQGNPSFTGHIAASPLFFNIVNDLKPSLPTSKEINLKQEKLHLTKINVCSATGMLPTPACPRTTSTWFIPGKSPIQKDTVYREVMINPQNGLRACRFKPDNQFVVYEFWPSDLLSLFKKAGIQRKTPPPFESDCLATESMQRGVGPEITSPKRALTYPVMAKTTQIPLTAITDGDVNTLHWFVNERYLGQSHSNPFWWQAAPGHYIIRAVDEYGRADAVDVKVTKVNASGLSH